MIPGEVTTVGGAATPPVKELDRSLPSIGRIVHYQSYGTPGGEYTSEPRAAVVTRVYMGSSDVSLCILNPTGQFFTERVKFSAEPKAGCWNWPPRQ